MNADLLAFHKLLTNDEGMNIFELAVASLIVALVLLCSRGLGHVVAIPDVLAVVPVIGFLMLSVRLLTKMPPRSLFFFSWFVAAASLVSMGLTHLSRLDFRHSILFTPIAGVGIVVIVFGWVRSKAFKSEQSKDIS